MDAQELARWAIRVSVVCYALRVTEQIWRPARIASQFTVYVWWTGCLFYLAHMILSFHAFHDWSHDLAVEFTADETARLFGIRRGEGVWVNYFFAVVWAVDCVRILRSRRHQVPTSRSIDTAISLFFAVMMFSATVIFGPSVYTWILIPVSALWIGLWLRRKITRQN